MPNSTAIDSFFDLRNEQYESVAYDELLLMPGLSRRGSFEAISLESRITRDIVLKSPIVSAAMDGMKAASVIVAQEN